MDKDNLPDSPMSVFSERLVIISLVGGISVWIGRLPVHPSLATSSMSRRGCAVVFLEFQCRPLRHTQTRRPLKSPSTNSGGYNREEAAVSLSMSERSKIVICILVQACIVLRLPGTGLSALRPGIFRSFQRLVG